MNSGTIEWRKYYHGKWTILIMYAAYIRCVRACMQFYNGAMNIKRKRINKFEIIIIKLIFKKNLKIWNVQNSMLHKYPNAMQNLTIRLLRALTHQNKQVILFT